MNNNFYSDVNSLAINGTNIFAGTSQNGIFLSNDNGLNWQSINTGLTDSYINALAISNTHVFAGTESGVFFTTIWILVI